MPEQLKSLRVVVCVLRLYAMSYVSDPHSPKSNAPPKSIYRVMIRELAIKSPLVVKSWRVELP